MKLAVFKNYGVGRYFAQLFDSIPDTTFFSHMNLLVALGDNFSCQRKKSLVLKATPEYMELWQ